MNLTALIAAFVGVALMSLTVRYGNKIKNRWLRYLGAAVGLIGSIAIMSSVPVLFGDNTTKTSAQAGNYLAALIVIVVIIKSIFFRNKKEENA